MSCGARKGPRGYKLESLAIIGRSYSREMGADDFKAAWENNSPPKTLRSFVFYVPQQYASCQAMLNSYLAQNEPIAYNRVGFLVPDPGNDNHTTLVVSNRMSMDTLIMDYRMKYPKVNLGLSISTLDVRLDDSDPHVPSQGACGL